VGASRREWTRVGTSGGVSEVEGTPDCFQVGRRGPSGDVGCSKPRRSAVRRRDLGLLPDGSRTFLGRCRPLPSLDGVVVDDDERRRAAASRSRAAASGREQARVDASGHEWTRVEVPPRSRGPQAASRRVVEVLDASRTDDMDRYNRWASQKDEELAVFPTYFTNYRHIMLRSHQVRLNRTFKLLILPESCRIKSRKACRTIQFDTLNESTALYKSYRPTD